VLILKQLKGTGVHATGSKSHNLYAHHTLESADVVSGLQRRALSTAAWELVRENFRHAGGGPAVKTVVTEFELELPELGELPLTEFEPGKENKIPTTAFGEVVGAVGKRDPRFIVTNADGNEASAMANINKALTIRHPTVDELYFQGPNGQVYEPLNEDACAGLAAAVSLFGGRSLWCSYESFVINGLPIWQTVIQAMAELRRKTPSTVTLFTAGALEQGRNGWTHQRPEVEAYFAAMMRNGNVFPLFPTDANSIQVAYDWALNNPQQRHRDYRLQNAAAGTHHAGTEPHCNRGRRDHFAGPEWQRQSRVRSHRRHGAAAGIRSSRSPGQARRWRAHRLGGQPASPVSSNRRCLEHCVAARRQVHERCGFRCAVPRRCVDRRQRRSLRDAGAGTAENARSPS